MSNLWCALTVCEVDIHMYILRMHKATDHVKHIINTVVCIVCVLDMYNLCNVINHERVVCVTRAAADSLLSVCSIVTHCVTCCQKHTHTQWFARVMQLQHTLLATGAAVRHHLLLSTT
jgi:hypothetical protein